jgi:hypothetical protein
MSPSDFHLYGKVKSALIGREIPDEIHLFEVVNENLNGSPDAESQSIFQSCIEHIERVIEA